MRALDILRRLDAGAEEQECVGTRTPQQAWADCERGDWMLWVAAHLLPRPLVMLAACDCADPTLEVFDDGAPIPAALLVRHLAHEWAEGRESPQTAWVAACAACAADAAYAYAAASASAADAYAAARKTSLARSADLVRARIPWADLRAALAAEEAR